MSLPPSQQRPVQISWSALRRAGECRQKNLRVLQGLSAPGQDGRLFLPGTVADRIMRAWLESPNPKSGEMVKMVPAVFRKYAFDDTEYKIKWRGNAAMDQASVKNFIVKVLTGLEPLLYQHVLDHRFKPELMFRTTVGIPFLDGRQVPVTLVGGVDIVVQMTSGTNEGKFIVWDLKATSSEDYARKVLGQLVFYHIALGHWLGDPSLMSGRAGLMMPAIEGQRDPLYDITPEMTATMMSRITRYAHLMWRRDFTPDKGPSKCRYCEVKGACSAFKIPTALDSSSNLVSFEDVAAARAVSAPPE